MSGPYIEYNTEHSRLEDVLKSIDRCGDYFVAGRLESLPPQMRVSSAGKIAFPILAAQVDSLIEAAEQAPYGRGPQTLLDRSVRDCWQIGAEDIDLGGARWQKSLASILKRVATGLGLPPDRVVAQLYKLLVYETGGFFAEHRDTEKVDGMVATLVISLPVEGEGGEVVIRHKDRKATLDMFVEDLGELAYAAFYADCVHRTEPVRNGHRISLVYNVVVKPGSQDVPTKTPDLSAQIDKASRILANWPSGEASPKKIVWLLEHEYSESGLSFDSLKGLDAPIGRTLAGAARRADCALYLGILRIQEEGTPEYGYVSHDGYAREIDYTGEPCPIDELYDGTYSLLGWVAPSGEADPSFAEIPLGNGEALPAGALDGAEPDAQTLLEATGNAGVSLRRSYRRAAFAIWPRSHAVPVIADGRIDGAVNFALREVLVAEDPDKARSQGVGLATQLIDAWPKADPYLQSERFMQETGQGVVGMLQLLRDIDDKALTTRFLQAVIPTHYHEDLNQALTTALESVDPGSLRSFCPEFVRINVPLHPGGVFNLLVRLSERPEGETRPALQEFVRTYALSAFQYLPSALGVERRGDGRYWSRPETQVLDDSAIRDVFLAGASLDLEAEADRAAGLLRRRPRNADPYRTLPMALKKIYDHTQALGDTPAVIMLWRYAAGRLLERSAFPPPGPEDKTIDAPRRCDCEHCRKLAAFCLDRTATVEKFRLRQDIRLHLDSEIRSARLDIECETVRRGMPHTLVCSKTPAGYEKRVERYAGDVESMRILVNAAPGVRQADIPQTLEKLRLAIDLSQ